MTEHIQTYEPPVPLWPVSTITATSEASALIEQRDKALKRRGGRTPFRVELKFTPEEWRQFGELANAANRSRYNYAKRARRVGCQITPLRITAN